MIVGTGRRAVVCRGVAEGVRVCHRPRILVKNANPVGIGDRQDVGAEYGIHATSWIEDSKSAIIPALLVVFQAVQLVQVVLEFPRK